MDVTICPGDLIAVKEGGAIQVLAVYPEHGECLVRIFRDAGGDRTDLFDPLPSGDGRLQDLDLINSIAKKGRLWPGKPSAETSARVAANRTTASA